MRHLRNSLMETVSVQTRLAIARALVAVAARRWAMQDSSTEEQKDGDDKIERQPADQDDGL